MMPIRKLSFCKDILWVGYVQYQKVVKKQWVNIGHQS